MGKRPPRRHRRRDGRRVTSRTPTSIEKERGDDDDAIDAIDAADAADATSSALENARDATTASHRSTFDATRNE